MSRWNDPEANIPNKILDDYIKDVIEPIRKKSAFGFNITDKDYFERQDKKIRKLSNIGYRLLNFISYCHLFYSYCLGYISNDEFNKSLIKNCDIFKIIQIDWKLLKEALQQKNVRTIQIFLNMIFKDLSELIRTCKILKNEKDREIFENQVESIIESQFQDYYNEEVAEGYFSKEECNMSCFLTYRDMNGYMENINYFINNGKLYVYKPFQVYSIFGEEEYFKDTDFEFLIAHQPVITD